MTKAEFIDSVAAKANLSKKEAGAAVDAVLDTISGTLAGGGDVAFTGFGKFHVQSRAAAASASGSCASWSAAASRSAESRPSCIRTYVRMPSGQLPAKRAQYARNPHR